MSDTIFTLGASFGGDTGKFIKELNNNQMLDEASKLRLVGDYFRWQSGATLRQFGFSAAAQVAPPNAQAQFNRTFSHQRWTDGEDLVEAEGVNGFNVRFSNIEADLDKIRDDLNRVFGALADLQSRLRTAMGEVATELNAINRQIHDLAKANEPNTFKPLPGAFIYENATVPNIRDEIQRQLEPYLKDMVQKPGKIWVDGTDPTKGLIDGMAADRLDTVVFNGKTMDVWKTNFGMVLREAVVTSGLGKPSVLADEFVTIGEIGKFATEQAGDIKQTFPDGFTVKQFIEKYGTRRLGNDSYLLDALKVLGDEERFDGVDKLTERLTTEKAAVLIRSGVDQQAVVGAIGLHIGMETRDVGVDSLKFASEDVRKALADGGKKTIAEVVASDPAELQRILKAGNVDMGIGEVAKLRGITTLATQLGRIGR